MYRSHTASLFLGHQPNKLMLSFLNIMDVRNLVDVSSFFLFEATGDSQDNCDPATEGDIGHVAIAMADDDAESCSYDLSDAARDNELDDCGPQAFVLDESSDEDDDDGGDEDGHDQEEEEEEEEEEEAHSYQTWNSEHNWHPTGRHRSGAAFDSRKDQLMTEAEKSRRFWEACLAS